MNTYNLKVFQQRSFCTCNRKLVRHILQRCRLIIILEIFSGKQNMMLLQSIKKCIIYLKPSCFHIGLLHGTVMLCQVIPIDILDIGRTSIIPVLKKKKKRLFRDRENQFSFHPSFLSQLHPEKGQNTDLAVPSSIFSV